MPNPLAAGLGIRRKPDPCAVVVFGASGDLTKRKLFPALYALAFRGLLPDRFAVVGVARSEQTTRQFLTAMRAAVKQHARDPFRSDVFESLAAGVRYVATEFADDSGEESPYAQVGLGLYQTDNDWIGVYQTRNGDSEEPGTDGGTYFEVKSETGGARTLWPRVGQAAGTQNLPDYWLKVTRTGDTITAAYSLDDPAAAVDPCRRPPAFQGEGADAAVQRIALGALADAACELGTSRAALLRDLVGNGPSRVSSDRLAAAVRSGVLHTIDEERERGTIDGTVALVLRGLVAAAPLEWIRQILDGLTG